MQITVASEVEPKELFNIRGGKAVVRTLAKGKPGDPGDFELKLTDLSADFSTPRHRHQIEQLRWVLKGSFAYAEGKFAREGELHYASEGVYYGGHAEQAATIISLHFGGPSGYGCLSLDELKPGHEALARHGTFHDGIYTVVDEQGRKHNRDSYEAIWEYLNNKPIEYPNPPRYREPVIIHPQTFRAKQVASGVQLRHLGSYTEASTQFRHIVAEAGSRITLGSARQQVIAFLRCGVLSDGRRRYPAYATVYLEAGEEGSLAVDERIELLEVVLPDLIHLGQAPAQTGTRMMAAA